MLRNIIFISFISIVINVFFVTVECNYILAAESIRVNGSGAALDMMKPVIAAYKKNNNTSIKSHVRLFIAYSTAFLKT